MEKFKNLIAFLDTAFLEYIIKDAKGNIVYCSKRYEEVQEGAIEVEDRIWSYESQYYQWHQREFTVDDETYYFSCFYDVSNYYTRIIRLKQDITTTLPNRNAIDTYLNSWCDLKNSYFVLCDVDDFKKVNDTYGHQVGDEVLKRIGCTFKKHMRDCDFAGRYGGEEFLLIFHTSDLRVVQKRLWLMREELRYHDDLPDLDIRFSSGIAFYNGEEPLEEIIRRVDCALYYVKEHGKNRDAVYDEKTKTCCIANL